MLPPRFLCGKANRVAQLPLLVGSIFGFLVQRKPLFRFLVRGTQAVGRSPNGASALRRKVISPPSRRCSAVRDEFSSFGWRRLGAHAGSLFNIGLEWIEIVEIPIWWSSGLERLVILRGGWGCLDGLSAGDVEQWQPCRHCKHAEHDQPLGGEACQRLG